MMVFGGGFTLPRIITLFWFDSIMPRRDHWVRRLPNDEISRLAQLSEQLSEALANANPTEHLRQNLERLSQEISELNLRNPLEHLEPIDTNYDDVTTNSGIYMFTNGLEQYIGLAVNVRIRFYIPLYGHLTSNNNSNSRHVINPGPWDAYLLEEYSKPESNQENVGTSLSSDEIFWYYLLLNHDEFDLVNTPAHIGRTRAQSGYPIISFCEEELRYELFRSIGSATNSTRVNSGNGLRHIMRARTSRYGMVKLLKTETGEVPTRYYQMRFATDEEAELLNQDEYGYDDLLERIRRNESDNCLEPQERGGYRSAVLTWNQGEVDPEVVNILDRYKRGSYITDGPQSQFEHGISWHSGAEMWQIRAKNGPLYTDLWQPTFDGTEFEAAVHRERMIVQNNWQEYNLPNRRGYPSNAAALNELLPDDQQLPLWG